MKHPESNRESPRDRNLHALTGHIDEPTIVMSTEDNPVLVQYGELKSFDTHSMALWGSAHRPFGEAEIGLPIHDTVIAGRQNVQTYAEELLSHFEQDDDLQAGVVAATIIHLFAESDDSQTARELCDHIAQAVIAAETDDDMLAACVFDAPRALKQPVLSEVQRRLRTHQTFYDLQQDRLAMMFIRQLSEKDGLSELEAATMLGETKA